MRFLLTLFLVLNGFFIFTKDVKAYTCVTMTCSASPTVSGCISANSTYDGNPGISSSEEGCCTSWCVQQIQCNTCNSYPDGGICDKGTTQCGLGYCSSTVNGCCSQTNDWTKYKVNCINNSKGYLDGVICTEQWVIAGSVCSNADKYNSSEPRMILTGNCDCSPGFTYKACCQNKVLVNAVTTNLDNKPPLEAYCPSGSTQIWNGGAAMSLAQAQAICNPPVATNGSCGISNNSCNAGTLNDIADSSTNYLWHCNGINGGSNDICSLAKSVLVNGVCNNSVNNGCTSGIWEDIADNSTNYLWHCNGINGGSNALNCSLAIPSSGLPWYFCKSGSCSATSSQYLTQSDCQTGLANCTNSTWPCFNSTGTCYSTLASCNSACTICICTSGSLSCNAGETATAVGNDGCGNTCYSCTIPTTTGCPTCPGGCITNNSCPTVVNGVCNNSVSFGCTRGSAFSIVTGVHTNTWFCSGSP